MPLIFISYGYSSGIRNGTQLPTSIIDIAPTVLTETGVPVPDTWQGIALQGDMEKRHLFFMMQPSEGLYDTKTNGLWKYWRNRVTGEEFVFDLTSDPAEHSNLLYEVPQEWLQEWRDIMMAEMK